jgi:cbb3-type cytochrome oxidase subunit 3
VTLLALVDDLLGKNWLGILSTTGMLIFFAVFVGVVIWIVTRSRRQIDRWSKLPLEDESDEMDKRDEKDKPDRS